MIEADIDHQNQKRACCRLLKELSQLPDSLKNPDEVAQALEVISQHCVLMKLMGQSAVKWDMSKSQCYLAFYPEDAQAVVDEINKTFASYDNLQYFDTLLFHLAGILAHNEKLKQISDKMPFVHAEIREKEKKLGATPETIIFRDKNVNKAALGAGDLLKAHPYLDKPQMDGAASKDTPNPVQHPEAAENAQRLQLQLQHQKQNQLQLGQSNAPKFTRGSGG
jgi:hypothetical protein